MKSCNIIVLTLSVVVLLHLVTATVMNENTAGENQRHLNENHQEFHRSPSTESKSSVFPNHLDINTLQNMPLIILHPRTPINFQMLPGESLASIHKSLTPSKILELLQSATISAPSNLSPVSVPSNLLPQSSNNRENRNRHIGNHQSQATFNHASSTQPDPQFNDPALGRSLMNPNMNNGWFQRVRGSFSNMFPRLRPSNGGPFPPTANFPAYHAQPSNMHGTIFPHPPFHTLSPWRKFNFHNPSTGHFGDLNTGASHVSPLRAMFGNLPMIGFRPNTGYNHPAFGGDLATSGSSFIPRRIIPPPYPSFALPRPPLQRHKPLFDNVDGLQAASMEISNAFADFTDSKEHGPEVTQKFGAVGHSINNFLKMMGLGPDLSFGHVGGFGGGADMAALDSTPIARSLDFYPGYGNQAHFDDFENLDGIDDFPIFEVNKTDQFMKMMNLTEGSVINENENPKKEITGTKAEMESEVEKEKIPMALEMKHKDHDEKSKKDEAGDGKYAPAVPLQKVKGEKLPVKKEHPTVRYKIPPIHSTVAPHDRKKPIAIYQNFDSLNNSGPKLPTYVTAQAMPPREEEENPNKLVDEDEVRQWRLVNSGKGYVEKHPVPILDILKSSKQPESLKVLQKVISDTVKKESP